MSNSMSDDDQQYQEQPNMDNMYVGDLKNNLPDGSGRMIYSTGDVYDGNFKLGKKQGDGFMVYANGDIYQGSWNENLFDGQGYFSFDHGRKNYEGSWINGLKDGFGKIEIIEVERFEGTWIKDLRNGYGICDYLNHSRYEGEYLDDKIHGFGKFIFSTGNIYECKFNQGIPSGPGKIIYTNGDIYEGNLENWVRHGKGTITYYKDPNDNTRIKEKYDGDWVNDKKHGLGIHYKNNDYNYQVLSHNNVVKVLNLSLIPSTFKKVCQTDPIRVFDGLNELDISKDVPICSISKNIICKPIITSCGHIFCKKNYQNYCLNCNTCPVCYSYVEYYKDDIHTKKIIDKLSFKISDIDILLLDAINLIIS
jgi:hypothetical protein